MEQAWTCEPLCRSVRLERDSQTKYSYYSNFPVCALHWRPPQVSNLSNAEPNFYEKTHR